MIIRSLGTQKEAEIVKLDILAEQSAKLMHYNVEYDTMQPEETIRSFVSSIKDMMSRYDGNKNRIAEIEKELVDVEHYIEISSNKTVTAGYKLYRQLADLRRERRACKNENELLQAIFACFNTSDILNRLTKVQGECAKAKESIDERTYQVRTKILDEYLNPKKEKKTESGEESKSLFSTFIEAKIPEEIQSEPVAESDDNSQ